MQEKAPIAQGPNEAKTSRKQQIHKRESAKDSLSSWNPEDPVKRESSGQINPVQFVVAPMSMHRF